MTSTTETRRLKGNDHLVILVIKEQAGTLDKAMLEGVMNSVDAGAPRVLITLDANRVVIEDQGKGIMARQEIEDFFETFGTKHEEGDARFGKFRMGRGQMFAFGRNTWRTGPFEMKIDIDKDGLDYQLTTGLPIVEGCRVEIEFYEPLSNRAIYQLSQDMKKMVKYLDVPVFFNNEPISTNPSKLKFSDSTDDAYIKLNPDAQTIEIYNQGVYVQSLSSYHYGMGGVVISKVPLTVNFARNMVMDKCPVWKRVRKLFDQSGEQRVTKRLALNGHERVNAINRLVAGDITANEMRQSHLFEDVNGKGWSPAAVMRAGFQNWTVADARDEKARLIQETGQAFVLARHIADLFDIPYQELFTTEPLKFDTWNKKFPTYAPLDMIEFDATAENSVLLPKDKWRPKEKIWLAVMKKMIGLAELSVNSMMETMAHEQLGEVDGDWRAKYDARRSKVEELQAELGLMDIRREIRIGSSKRYCGWTDGRSYVAFSREHISRLTLMKHGQPYARDILEVGTMLLKMILSDMDSRQSDPDASDHKLYFDLSTKALPTMLSQALDYLTPAKYKELAEKYKGSGSFDEDEDGGSSEASEE